MWIQLLFFKTKALDLIEIGSGLKGNYVVGADANNWQVCGIFRRVKCKSGFTGNDLLIENRAYIIYI